MTTRRTPVATADHCMFLYGPPPTGVGSEEARQRYKTSWEAINERDRDADAAVAQAAMEWICTVDARGNDYLMNLKGLVLKAEWTHKDLGLGASLISAYLREQGKIAERAEREAADAERLAAAEPCPTGKITVTGVVIKTDKKVNDFGTREVWTVQDDRGFRVWGTIPKALVDQGVKVGNRVTFGANVEQSDSDEFFGFSKGRASKPSIIVDPAQADSCEHIAWDAYSEVPSIEEDGVRIITKTTCTECHAELNRSEIRKAVEAAGLVMVRGHARIMVRTMDELLANADGDEEVVNRMLY